MRVWGRTHVGESSWDEKSAGDRNKKRHVKYVCHIKRHDTEKNHNGVKN